MTKSLMADPTRPDPPVTITTDGVVVSVDVLVSSAVISVVWFYGRFFYLWASKGRVSMGPNHRDCFGLCTDFFVGLLLWSNDF